MNDLKNSHILITGGAGFVGSHIATQLLNEEVGSIVLLDNFVRGSMRNIAMALKDPRVKLVEGDIRDAALLDELCSKADYVFHMAALRITRCADNPDEAFEVMYRGTYNLIKSCINGKIKKLVAASSASIYGQAEHFPTTEKENPYNNRTLYGAAKMANELMYRSFAEMSQLNYVAMRYFNIYGPHMDVEGKYTEVLIRWYKLIKSGQSPKIFGSGDQTMDFVNVRDVARANIFAMKSSVGDEVFNVGMHVETSLKELCFCLLEVMGSKLAPEFIPVSEERKAVEVYRRLASVQKAEELLDFRAEIDLKTGLTELVDWLDKQKVELL